jgi:hypothetical protein
MTKNFVNYSTFIFYHSCCETRLVYDTFVVLFKHCFVMQPLQNPPICGRTISRSWSWVLTQGLLIFSTNYVFPVYFLFVNMPTGKWYYFLCFYFILWWALLSSIGFRRIHSVLSFEKCLSSDNYQARFLYEIIQKWRNRFTRWTDYTVNLCLVIIKYKNPSWTSITIPQKYVFDFKE